LREREVVAGVGKPVWARGGDREGLVDRAPLAGEEIGPDEAIPFRDASPRRRVVPVRPTRG
jgi:hypothetical protein